ncbi:aldehyde-activating protein [Jannaschia pagri]|uniref:Aldehyde-activating protein n=1 Tax=Jannaschia pagri TaxID=2829797 RepID=A0ABQ4NQQ2_9RHOB|nr:MULTISPECIES: GFA family protein [unclassified Jannaschia]GIT92907.1 aldehyde-activating protein [Jannaschia sp. AI_61]GIT96742.1 aldehyde-activating protein [Jannaschia sp. AI_62]
MAETLTGRCLCGACTFTAQEGPQGAGVCHCGMCRNWSGGIFLSVDCGTSVEFAEGSPVGSYKGSAWGERIFCKDCGSSLLWQTQDGANQHVSIQCFEDPSRFDLGIELFIDRKPANYALMGERQTMTEAQVFAMFAPEGEAK